MGNFMFCKMGKHVSSTGEVKNACKNLAGKLERKRLYGDMKSGGKILFFDGFLGIKMRPSRKFL